MLAPEYVFEVREAESGVYFSQSSIFWELVGGQKVPQIEAPASIEEQGGVDSSK